MIKPALKVSSRSGWRPFQHRLHQGWKTDRRRHPSLKTPCSGKLSADRTNSVEPNRIWRKAAAIRNLVDVVGIGKLVETGPSLTEANPIGRFGPEIGPNRANFRRDLT